MPKTQKCKAILIDLTGYFFGLPNSIFGSVRLKFCACLALFTNHQVAFRQNAPNVKNDKIKPFEKPKLVPPLNYNINNN